MKGPKKAKDQDSVQGLFDKARQSGAEEGTAADLRPQVPHLPAGHAGHAKCVP